MTVLYPIVKLNFYNVENMEPCDCQVDCSQDPGPVYWIIMAVVVVYSFILVINTNTLYNSIKCCCFDIEPLDINYGSWIRGTFF